ncbi:hypothetical protein G7Y79_00020g048990 [Physcia stellaris]|nr:hypothetical protein G7Y79_00020g048990 [Physcia stellaris]
MSDSSRSSHKAPKKDTPKESRYHYSVRLQPSTSPDPSEPSRKTIPRPTQHLSLDYSFVHHETLDSPHPSLQDIDARIAKHIRYICSLCRHHHSFHSFKLILLTAKCCNECNEASITRTFGYFSPSPSTKTKLSSTQQALLKLKPMLRDNFSVVAYLDPVVYHRPPQGDVANKHKSLVAGQRFAEIGEHQSELGVKVDAVQVRAQVDLEVVKDWPVVFSWFCWSR